jgi:hypothetical protein
MTSLGFKISKHFADVMVKVHKLCFSTAITQLNVNISAEKQITIIDTTFGSSFESTSLCDVDKDYKVVSTAPFSNALDTRLNNSILSRDVNVVEFNEYKKKVKFIVDQFISVQILSKCLAVAVSSITLRLNAVSTVTINNLQIDQAARAVILGCVQNTRVSINGKSKTLAQHIDDLDAVPVQVLPVDPEEEEAAEKAAQKEIEDFNKFLKDWAAEKPVCGKDNQGKITIATSIGMAGILIMIIVLIVVARNKKKLAKQ